MAFDISLRRFANPRSRPDWRLPGARRRVGRERRAIGASGGRAALHVARAADTLHARLTRCTRGALLDDATTTHSGDATLDAAQLVPVRVCCVLCCVCACVCVCSFVRGFSFGALSLDRRAAAAVALRTLLRCGPTTRPMSPRRPPARRRRRRRRLTLSPRFAWCAAAAAARAKNRRVANGLRGGAHQLLSSVDHALVDLNARDAASFTPLHLVRLFASLLAARARSRPRQACLSGDVKLIGLMLVTDRARAARVSHPARASLARSLARFKERGGQALVTTAWGENCLHLIARSRVVGRDKALLAVLRALIVPLPRVLSPPSATPVTLPPPLLLPYIFSCSTTFRGASRRFCRRSRPTAPATRRCTLRRAATRRQCCAFSCRSPKWILKR